MDNMDKNEQLFKEFDDINKDDPNNFISGWGLREKVIDDGGYHTFLILLGCIENKYKIGEEDREYTEEEIKKLNEKTIELALDYLYPLLREGKLKLKIKKKFNNPEEVKEELQKVKTEDQKSKLKELLNNDNIYWNREQLREVEEAKHNKLEKLENVDWNKEPIVNYVFYKEQADLAIQELKRCWEEVKHDEKKREEFEEFNVMFTLPENDFFW